MRSQHLNSEYLPFLMLICLISVAGCKKEGNPNSSSQQDMFGPETYDISTNGIPKFVGVDYVELEKIADISKFRSGIGHDYSDDFESCRSMKHYFEPKSNINWSSVRIYSPIEGTVIFLLQEGGAGTKVQIKSKRYPAFFFDIFHVNLATPLKVGDVISTGQYLGNHIGNQTMSDIEVAVHTPIDGPKNIQPPGWKLISYFDVITDSIFQKYQARGLPSRAQAIITKEARDADALICNGESFTNSGTLENWVTLN